MLECQSRAIHGYSRAKGEPMSLTRQLLAATGLVLVASLGPAVCPASAQAATGSEVARVGDRVVTLGEVDDAWNQSDAVTRMRMLQQVYDARRRALDLVIGDLLIEREADSRGVSREELLAAELPSRTLPVTDEEVQLIYERNQNVLGGRPLEDVRSQVVAAIEQQRPMQALRQYMEELRADADDVAITLASLDPPRQQIAVLADDPARGPSNAPILLVEFSDFECPFCQRATGTLDELFDRYQGQIRFVYKDYPLPNHPNAFKAAEAGNCAHEQEMFWEFHDKMFGSQDALEVPALKEYASELGLDAAAFSACLDEGRHASRVQRDVEIGQEYGVSSTPTVFINGRPVLGAAPLETFDQIILEELSSSQP